MANLNCVTIFEHINFEGKSKELSEGNYDMNELGIGNDQLSSFKVPQGFRVTLYEHEKFQGKCKSFVADCSSVNTFNDITSSIKVELIASIFKDANYGGERRYLSVGDYDVARITLGNDQVSSLKVPEGLKVTLYEHEKFGGRSKSFTSDTPFVGDDFNDLTSSIKVEKVKVRTKNTEYAEAIPRDKDTHTPSQPTDYRDFREEAYQNLLKNLDRVDKGTR